jgi:hypothetical protein
MTEPVLRSTVRAKIPVVFEGCMGGAVECDGLRMLDFVLRGAVLSRPVDYRHFTQQV